MTKYNPILARRNLGTMTAAVSRTRQGSVAAIAGQLDIGRYRSLAFRSGTPTDGGLFDDLPRHIMRHYIHPAGRPAPPVHQLCCDDPGWAAMEQCFVREQCSPGHLQIMASFRRSSCRLLALAIVRLHQRERACDQTHPAQSEKVTYTFRPTNAVMQIQ